MAPPRRRAVTSPALAAFGRQLRRYREAAGLSQARIAQRTGTTASFVSQIENGRKRCKRTFVEAIELDLKSGGVLLGLYDDLTNDGALAFPTWFDWPAIEAEAIMIVSWSPLVVDGLLQIEEYAAAILRGNQKALQARLARQEILTRDDPPPPRYALLLDEGVLYRETGDPGVMRKQLTHLVDRISDRLTVQIVPSRGEPLGTGGAVKIAKMEDMGEVAHLDTSVRGFTLGEPDDLAAAHDVLSEMRAMAHSVRESVEIINRAVEEKWN